MASIAPPDFSPTGPVPTAGELYSTYRRIFKQQVYEGVRRPILLPYSFLSIIILIAYLCIPHKQNSIVYAARWPLVFLLSWFELRAVHESSGVGVDLGYRTGATSVINIMIIWTWLIFKRPQWDAKRVERRKVRVAINLKEAELTEKSALNEKSCPEKLVDVSIPSTEDSYYEARTGNGEIYEYFWQPYPEDLKERLSWVIDLVSSPRGTGWNWAISTIPRLTPEIQSKLGSSSPDVLQSGDSLIVKRRFSAYFEHLINLIYMYIKWFILIDVLRAIMLKDPYFKFGPATTYELPSYLQQLNPSVLQFYRLLLSLFSTVTCLLIAFANINFFLSCILGPKVLGLRGEPWYYPKAMGDFSHVLDKGLNGLWSRYWHQTFRLYFTAPTTYLINEGYLKAGHYSTKVLGLLFAFGLSAFLHWACCMTSFNPFSSIRGDHEAIFFLTQALGVVLQDGLCRLFSGLIEKLPMFIRRTGNLLYTFGWLYLTGWLIADDFTRVGFWITEPSPFSFMQGLGLGEQNAGWFCWKPSEVIWYSGKNWLENGISFL